ncbi:MAG: adenylyltransferase/cytidyltransferase family protein [Lachnospiraceae bacterium]|nr:adenylyltransferase/cytidyltransferase family protein [Lachnospiraceae bacterium]MDE6252009.1 adenylyltransferase/cytidyltransferase family protein [Lachnospiraceae bacterium]
MQIKNLFDETEVESKCYECEAFSQNKDILKIEGIYYVQYIYPLLREITNRTIEEEELLSQMSETIHVDMLKNNWEFYSKLLDKYDTEEEAEKVIKLVPVVNKNGCRVPADFFSEKFNVVGNERVTTSIPKEYRHTIYIFGKSEVFGKGVEDADTIASYLQRLVNKQYPNTYRVVNKGVSAISDKEVDNYIKHTIFKKGDIVINIFLKRRCFDYENRGCFYHNSYKELAPAFNRIQNRESMFLDSVPHMNYKGNKVIADEIFSDIEEYLAENLKNTVENSINDTIILETAPNENIDDNLELKEYLEELSKYKVSDCNNKKIGSIVMNCNPFTLGHQYLIKKAAGMVDTLYIFVVEEDKSIFPFEHRFEMVKRGTENIDNVVVLPSGRFMISSLTFPEYFLKGEDNSIAVDTSLDVDIFGKYIADKLNISVRFAGEEPFDAVTRQYNASMKDRLPHYGVEFVEIKRKTVDETVISATTVRKYIKEKKYEELSKMVPDTTFGYLADKGYI